jgi:hypothetical protein
MPSSFNEILSTLTGSREAVLPSAEVFPVTDVDQLTVELRVVERGQVDGTANLPASTDLSEMTVESDIRAETERRAAKAHRDYLAQLDLYDGRIRRASITADLRTSIEAAGEKALVDFGVQVSDDINRLHRDRDQVEGRQAEFTSFRSVHNLTRLPRHRSHVEIRWLIIIFLFVVESFINGSFFAKGSQTGLIGGVIQAVVLSLFNIGGAVIFGRLILPYVTHRNHWIKGIAVIAIVSYAVWIVALNLAVGHFRDLFIARAGEVELGVLRDRLFSTPFGLADTDSLVLVALGMFFNLIALGDAFGIDDPYPRYGSIGRSKDAAIEAYSERRTQCLDDLRARRDEAIADMSQIIEDVRSRQHDVQLAINGRFRLHQHYDSYLEHLRDCHVRLVQRYREANVRARTSSAPPQFSGPPSVPRALAPPLPLDELRIDSQINQHVIDRMEHFIRNMSKEYEAQAARYTPISDIVGRIAEGRNG